MLASPDLRDGRAGERDNAVSDIEELSGGGSRDVIVGNGGSNHLEGEGGNDLLIGGGGRDHLEGEDGHDTIRADDGERDLVNCGKGADLVFADGRDVAAADRDSVCERVR